MSRFFSCPAFPAGNGPDYVNAAAKIDGPGDPAEMLTILHEIEAHFERTRERRWGQRTLDLDMIAAGASVSPDEETHRHWREMSLEDQQKRAPDTLILPHPRVQERAFVLVPLADIAPEWCHPILGCSVLKMRDALPEAALAEMTPLE